MLAGRVLVIKTVVGATGLFAGALLAGALLAGALLLPGALLAGLLLAGGPLAGALLLPGALLAGLLLAGGLLGLAWVDSGIGTGVCLSVLLLLGITGLTTELEGGTVTTCVAVVGTSVTAVLLGSFCRLAMDINLVAMAAFSWCTASMAVRSSRNTPCLNLVGE